MQKLCKKLLQTFPGQINGKFMMLGKWMYFDKNKQPPKIKDNKNISSSKAIKFCEKYNFGLSEQQLKQKLMKELVLMTTERVKQGQETIESKLDTIHVEQATLRITSGDNGN